MNDTKTEKTRVKLLLSYDGSDFKGWQKQVNQIPTVQLCIEKALTHLFNTPISIFGASRTDTGVHALGQVAHFDVSKPLQNYHIVRALNHLTPPSIVCLKAWKVSKDFHSLFSLSRKTYKYVICTSPSPTAFVSRYAHWEPNFDLAYMNQASQCLVGKRNFACFQNRGASVATTERIVYEAKWRQRTKGWVDFSITGSGFLKQMVRNIVGTQLDMMKKKETHQKLEQIIQSQKRSQAGPTAPPCGLYLSCIEYPKEKNFHGEEI